MNTFDPRGLERLAVDVSHWAFTMSFVQKYRRLLPQRVGRILTATNTDDLDQALDATLSLRVSSSFVGAVELVEMSRDIEARLRAGDVVGASVRAGLLHDAAERADLALAAYLSAREDR